MVRLPPPQLTPVSNDMPNPVPLRTPAARYQVPRVDVVRSSALVAIILAASSVRGSGQEGARPVLSREDASAPRRVAVTIDDVPGVPADGMCDANAVLSVNRRMVDHLVAADAPATVFVVEGRICDELRETLLPRVLSLWLDAGFSLGNHSFSHLDLNTSSLETYQRDVLRGETVTRRALAPYGRSLRYFRFPMLHTGQDPETKLAMERFLKEHGYRNAPVTIDNQEWVFANAYRQARRRSDAATAECVAAAYVPFMESVVAFFEGWSRRVVGYEPPQVLLLHVNTLNAAYLGDVLTMLERRGYQFVSLDDALADPAYQLPDTYVGRQGLSWVHRWAIARGIPVREEPREPRWVRALAGGSTDLPGQCQNE